MVMIIINIGYVTCLVTNDAWHAYDVIGSIRYITELVGLMIYGADNTVVGWYGHGEVGTRNI